MVAFTTEAPPFDILAFGESVFRGTLSGAAGNFNQLTTKDWLRSDNYVVGVSGYELSDTTAIFNEGTFRQGCEFRGTITVDSTGLGNAIDFEDNGTPVASFITTSSLVRLEATGGASVEVGNIGILISGDGSQDIVINPSLANLVIPNLPTTNPGGTNLVWRDASGYVRIT